MYIFPTYVQLASRVFKMASWIHVFLIVHLLLIQGFMNESIHCKEAVQSVETVPSCPTSKEQWDKAASRKKCWEKALKQTCSVPEKFVYHCVINGYANATLEVCAPQRIILGHCTEFNEVGGVIQDQIFSPCSNVFPRCDDYYLSSEAYKYEDCYKLVEAKKIKSDRDETTIPILTVGMSLFGVFVLVIVIVYANRRKINRWRREEKESLEDSILSGRTYDKKRDQKKVHEKEIQTVFIKVQGSEGNSEDQFPNKSCSSSESRNDNPDVLSESQTLIGQGYDRTKLGVYEVKRRPSIKLRENDKETDTIK